jgi:polyisoprenoid-binding protein YceI
LQSSALPLGYVAGLSISGWRESNPRVNLGKVAGYHYITPALTSPFGSPRRPSLPLRECADAMLDRSILRLALCALAFPLAALPLVASADTTAKIDPGHSSAEFSVRHLVVAVVRGRIPIVDGTVVTAPGSNQPNSIAATLDAAHLTTENDRRDADLRGLDWFDVTKYPTMTFRSTKIVAGENGAFSATGDLTLHGVTKRVTLAGNVLGATVDPRGRHHVGYEATTTLDRRDFGLTLLKESPGSGLIAGTEITIDLDVETIAGS